MTTLVAEHLTDESFAPFGRVVGKPSRDHDADGPGWRWWAEIRSLESDGRRWAFGYLDLQPAPLRFDWAERHLQSHEVVLAGPTDMFVYVAPGDPQDPDRLPPGDRFRAFRVPAGAGVVLGRGVWHGAPLVDDGPASALVLLLEGTGRDDVVVERFPHTPITIEVAS